MSGFESRPTGVAQRSSAVKQAWKLTNEDMQAIAEQRRADGWTVVAMPAVHTSPVSTADGDDDRFGLVHIIPDNHAEAFADASDAGDYPDYLVYRRDVDGSVFIVTELMDPDAQRAIIIAGHYVRRLAAGMVHSVQEEGAIYTHAKTIGGRELGSFRHEEYEPFLSPKAGGSDAPDA